VISWDVFLSFDRVSYIPGEIIFVVGNYLTVFLDVDPDEC